MKEPSASGSVPKEIILPQISFKNFIGISETSNASFGEKEKSITPDTFETSKIDKENVSKLSNVIIPSRIQLPKLDLLGLVSSTLSDNVIHQESKKNESYNVSGISSQEINDTIQQIKNPFLHSISTDKQIGKADDNFNVYLKTTIPEQINEQNKLIENLKIPDIPKLTELDEISDVQTIHQISHSIPEKDVRQSDKMIAEAFRVR